MVSIGSSQKNPKCPLELALYTFTSHLQKWVKEQSNPAAGWINKFHCLKEAATELHCQDWQRKEGRIEAT